MGKKLSQNASVGLRREWRVRDINYKAPEISVVVPLYNEADNLPWTLERIARALRLSGRSWEIVAVDDGSTDATKSRLEAFASENIGVRVISYRSNRGRGFALRQGFTFSRGQFICTTDADLSYGEEYLPAMVAILVENPEIDLVVGSPYMPGGKVTEVPASRLWVSKVANRLLGFALPGELSTVTGILRAYRRQCVQLLDLESDGKEIHLEILSKALAMGFRVYELPVILRGRRKGKSKFKFSSTAVSHLVFSFFERPILLFGIVGLFLGGLALLAGGYVVYLWRTGKLNPNRPLLTLIVILSVSGLQVFLFGFLGTQLVLLRKELYRLKRITKERRKTEVIFFNRDITHIDTVTGPLAEAAKSKKD